MYDNNSDIFGVIYNDTEYYYIKNAQNDVIAIADADGNVLIKYAYDAWGKVIAVTDKDGNEITESTDEPTNPSNDIDESVGEGLRALPQTNEDSVGADAHIDPQNTDDTTVGNGVLDVPSTANEPTTADESASLTKVDPQIATIADLNPILYRSYYYDKETEWYYLNTRYYSPDMCRFINADGYVQTGQGMLDKNMFAYCGNNPINNIDTNGNRYSSAANAARKIAIKAVRAGVENNLSKNFNVYVCKRGEEQNAPTGSVVVINGRKKGAKKDNNFEIVGSWQISDKELQEKICQAIIDYNKNHPDDSGWNRDIDTMLVE